jgi:hypothetical protein
MSMAETTPPPPDRERRITPRVLFSLLLDHFQRQSKLNTTPEQQAIDFMRAFSPAFCTWRRWMLLNRSLANCTRSAIREFYGVGTHVVRKVMEKEGIALPIDELMRRKGLVPRKLVATIVKTQQIN